MPKPITINDTLLDTELSSTLRDAVKDKKHELARMAVRLEAKGATQAARILDDELRRLDMLCVLFET